MTICSDVSCLSTAQNSETASPLLHGQYRFVIGPSAAKECLSIPRFPRDILGHSTGGDRIPSGHVRRTPTRFGRGFCRAPFPLQRGRGHRRDENHVPKRRHPSGRRPRGAIPIDDVHAGPLVHVSGSACVEVANETGPGTVTIGGLSGWTSLS